MNAATLRARIAALAQELEDTRGEGLSLAEIRRRFKLLRAEVDQLRAEMDVAKGKIQDHEARLAALEV